MKEPGRRPTLSIRRFATIFRVRLTVWAAVCSFGGAVSARATAASGCGGSGPWVIVSFEGAWPDGFSSVVLTDLSAGLSARGVDACRSGTIGAQPASATVTIAPVPGASTRASIEVRDTVTDKSVRREVNLASVPSDGRPLALALAADELLFASWAELALASQAEHRRQAPIEVIEAVQRDLPKPDVWNLSVGARGAVESFDSGLVQLGGDGVLLARVLDAVFLELSLSIRQGLPKRSEHGEVTAQSLGVGTAARAVVLELRHVRFDLGLGVNTGWFQFQGIPGDGAAGGDFAALAIDARALLRASAVLTGPLRAELGAGGGAVLRTVEVTDTEDVVSGVSGLGWMATLGLGVDL